ncbi:MAG: TraR/DksA family transcriptional regulator, partial [Pseudomonadota bacterium]
MNAMQKESKATPHGFSAGTRHEAAARNVSRVSRRDALRTMLRQMRDQELSRLDEFARSETRHDAILSADEFDNARSQEDLDLKISLIDLAESRLNSATKALERLEQNDFGICSGCGDEISFERLRAVPMAARCVDCQQALEGSARSRRMRGANPLQEPTLFDAYQGESRGAEASEQDGAPVPAPERTGRRGRPSARQ